MQPSPPQPSRSRLRQIALVAEDLGHAKYLLTSVLGTEVVFVDPGVGQWGLENFLVAIGGDLIEVVSPMRPDTTAGRLLSRRGDGGYMIIMQTDDAKARREHIETNRLAKVIYSADHGSVTSVQYHPKGIRGGMMPELDSHAPSSEHPDPLLLRYSPWHAAGPDYASYSAAMKRSADLRLVGISCRLAAGDNNTETAARQWEETFGIQRQGDQLIFTNATMDLVSGEPVKPEGLLAITIAVQGKARMNAILDRAAKAGLCGDGWINMVGVRWYLVLVDELKARI